MELSLFEVEQLNQTELNLWRIKKRTYNGIYKKNFQLIISYIWHKI